MASIVIAPPGGSSRRHQARRRPISTTVLTSQPPRKIAATRQILEEAPFLNRSTGRNLLGERFGLNLFSLAVSLKYVGACCPLALRENPHVRATTRNRAPVS